MRHVVRQGMLFLLCLCLACGSDPGNDVTPRVDLSSCTAANTLPVALAVGQYVTVDAIHQTNCALLPGSSTAQEYVVVAYSGYGASSTNGTFAGYALQSQVVGAPGATARAGLAGSTSAPGNANLTTPERFDLHLRLAERALALSPARHFGALAMPPSAPPAVGDQDSFYVCSTSDCNTFGRVGATVQYAGNPGVIYLDDHLNVGADQFTAGDFQQLGQLFDNYLYAADTAAFGRESDINGDRHIAILVTPAVNHLTSNCSNGQIIGYTFSNDLLPFASGSNAREMFYTLTTANATASCAAVTRAQAMQALPPTLIHELQHMISFNQHVLLRNGSDQEVWMNEGLSHFAEELGWRAVPASQCGGDCFPEFMGGDIGNAYRYLNDPDAEYLIAPEAGDGTLPQRGASWLFLRWIADHFAMDSVLGTQFTRGMEQSAVLGAARVAQWTGVNFPALVGEWQMANWTSDLPGFPQDGILTYRTWDFRSVYAANYPGTFAKPFPLTPDSTAGEYSHLGTLPAGSGKTVRYILNAGSPGVTIRLSGDASGGPLDAGIVPWLAIVRVQ